jgi:hypothetical protein
VKNSATEISRCFSAICCAVERRPDGASSRSDELASRADDPDWPDGPREVPSRWDEPASSTGASIDAADELASRADEFARLPDDLASRLDEPAPLADASVSRADESAAGTDELASRADESVPPSDELAARDEEPALRAVFFALDPLGLRASLDFFIGASVSTERSNRVGVPFALFVAKVFDPRTWREISEADI